MCIRDSNNAAQLTTIHLEDQQVLKKEWLLLLDHFKDKIQSDPNFTDKILIGEFTPYFQKLFHIIIEELTIETQYACIFYHDYLTYKTKVEHTSHIHMDTNREAAVSIPIETPDPLLFYNFDEKYLNNKRLHSIKKPNQILNYEHNHPTLINTRNLHNVFVLDESLPRVLLQIHCYESFNSIYQRNQNKLRVL